MQYWLSCLSFLFSASTQRSLISPVLHKLNIKYLLLKANLCNFFPSYTFKLWNYIDFSQDLKVVSLTSRFVSIREEMHSEYFKSPAEFPTRVVDCDHSTINIFSLFESNVNLAHPQVREEWLPWIPHPEGQSHFHFLHFSIKVQRHETKSHESLMTLKSPAQSTHKHHQFYTAFNSLMRHCEFELSLQPFKLMIVI